MSENFSLGKKGKFGNVDFSKIMQGIKKDDIAKGEKADAMKSLFDLVDKNKDGVLSREEINNLQEKLAKLDEDTDNNLTKKELEAFSDNNGQKLDRNIRKQLANFLVALQANSVSKGVKNVQDTDNNSEIITYDDGHSEEIFDDGSRIITQKQEGKTIVTKKDSQGNLVEEKTTTENGDETVVEYKNGQPAKTVKTSNGGKLVETTKRVNGQEIKSVVDAEKGTTVEYINGTKVKEKTSDAATIYRSDGTSTTTSNDGTKTTVKDASGKILSQVENETLENGSKKRTETKFDGENSISNTFIDNKKMSQTKVVDGKTHTVNYDGNGNTTGIIVQHGESLSKLAKKFGCTVQEIIDANPGVFKGDFVRVGTEIKIPKELPADHPELINRKSATEAEADYNNWHAERVRQYEEARAREIQDSQGTQNSQDVQDGETASSVDEDQAKNNAEGKKIAEDLFDDIDGWGTGKDFETNVNKINKGNVIAVLEAYAKMSPDESLIEAIFDEVGRGIVKNKTTVKYIYEQLRQAAIDAGVDVTESDRAFEKAMNLKNGTANNKEFDPIFNSLIVAIKGKSSLTAQEKQEIKNTSAKELQNNAVEHLGKVAENATKALIEQLDYDGWAADLYEGLKWLVNSDQLDEKVREDIDKLKAQIAVLKTAKTPEEFNLMFKEIFGVDFDPELIKVYEKIQEQLVQVETHKAAEEMFKETFKELLSNSELRPRTKTYYHDGMSYTEVETASKQTVYNETIKQYALIMGKGDEAAGMAEIEQAFAELGVGKNASIDEKWVALRKLAMKQVELLEQTTLAATDGVGYEQFKAEADSAYRAAFGHKNDVAKRVADYNTSQQVGGMVIKGITKGAAAIGLALIPGVNLALAAVGTAAISVGVDVSDRLSSEVGLQEGEILEILKNAAIDGATVYAGGKLTQMLMKSSTFLKIGGQITGDAVVGAAAEKLQTGQITLGGVLFQCVFSAAGNLVELRAIGKGAKGNTPDAPAPSKPRPKNDPPKYEIPQNESALDKAVRNSNNPNEVAPARSVGKLNDAKFAEVKADLQIKLDNISTLDDVEALERIQKQIDALQDRTQRDELQKMLDAKKTELANMQPKGAEAEVEVEVVEVRPNDVASEITPSVEQSRSFNRKHKIDAGTRIEDGYKDGGRGLRFDDSGNPINEPTREIIVVNRSRDQKLNEIILDVKRKTANMSDKDKAAFLQQYICDISGGKNPVASDNWTSANVGKEIYLGDIITANPSVAVCRHRSLLFKILGDEVGLKIELQRGNFIDSRGSGGHAWNVVKFEDGTSAIYDAMHNKTSSITSGKIDDYAKQYHDVDDKRLYV